MVDREAGQFWFWLLQTLVLPGPELPSLLIYHFLQNFQFFFKNALHICWGIVFQNTPPFFWPFLATNESFWVPMTCQDHKKLRYSHLMEEKRPRILTEIYTKCRPTPGHFSSTVSRYLKILWFYHVIGTLIDPQLAGECQK